MEANVEYAVEMEPFRCPFCGSWDVGVLMSSRSAFVVCYDCEAQGPREERDDWTDEKVVKARALWRWKMLSRELSEKIDLVLALLGKNNVAFDEDELGRYFRRKPWLLMVVPEYVAVLKERLPGIGLALQVDRDPESGEIRLTFNVYFPEDKYPDFQQAFDMLVEAEAECDERTRRVPGVGSDDIAVFPWVWKDNKGDG